MCAIAPFERERPGVLALVIATALAAVLAASSVEAQGTAGRDTVARGKYMFGAAGGCACHTEKDRPVNSGGRKYDGPFGSVFSSNITPDRQTGIGDWTDDQIITAIRLGRGRTVSA